MSDLLSKGRALGRRWAERLFRRVPATLTHRPLICQSMPPTAGVTVVGFPRAVNGVGEATRSSLRALHGHGFPLAQINLATDDPPDADRSCAHIPDNVGYTINLMHVNPDLVYWARRRLGSGFFRAKRNIGFWFWEMADVPRFWRSCSSLYDEIWTASQYAASNLAKASSVPVHRVPLLVEPERPVHHNHATVGLPEDRFIFLFIFDVTSILERKNPYALIEAYRRAFVSRPETTALVIQLNNRDRTHGREAAFALEPGWLNRLAAAVASVQGILLDQRLSRTHINALIAQCDCYVSLHRCEGFGMTLAEAMYFGKPCIATGYSANLDFMTPQNSYLVDYRLAALDRSYGPYRAGWMWADPDIDHAAALMRRVVQNPEEASARALQASADIRSSYSLSAASRAMLARLPELALSPSPGSIV